MERTCRSAYLVAGNAAANIPMYHPRRHARAHAQSSEHQIHDEECAEGAEDADRDREPKAEERRGAVVAALEHAGMTDVGPGFAVFALAPEAKCRLFVVAFGCGIVQEQRLVQGIPIVRWRRGFDVELWGRRYRAAEVCEQADVRKSHVVI
jgi:hypothetical protein